MSKGDSPLTRYWAPLARRSAPVTARTSPREAQVLVGESRFRSLAEFCPGCLRTEPPFGPPRLLLRENVLTPIVPTLGLFRPEGRPAWSATGFAGTRSEQSGSSADAAAHHVGVNDRAHGQAEHDYMQLLSLMLIGFVGCPRRVRPIDRATALRCPPAGPLLALLDGLGLFRPSRVGRLAGWADSGTGRNNHDLGTIGVRRSPGRGACSSSLPLACPPPVEQTGYRIRGLGRLIARLSAVSGRFGR